MENTYVVYSDEYYFSLNSFSTVLKKRVYHVSYNMDSAEEVKSMMEEVLQKTVDAASFNSNREMLTAYDIKVVTLEGKHSIEEAKELVVDDDYTWGRAEGRGR